MSDSFLLFTLRNRSLIQNYRIQRINPELLNPEKFTCGTLCSTFREQCKTLSVKNSTE